MHTSYHFLFLGDGAIPFTLEFPDLAPNSVLICADESEDPANVVILLFYVLTLSYLF